MKRKNPPVHRGPAQNRALSAAAGGRRTDRAGRVAEASAEQETGGSRNRWKQCGEVLFVLFLEKGKYTVYGGFDFL